MYLFVYLFISFAVNSFLPFLSFFIIHFQTNWVHSNKLETNATHQKFILQNFLFFSEISHLASKLGSSISVVARQFHFLSAHSAENDPFFRFLRLNPPYGTFPLHRKNPQFQALVINYVNSSTFFSLFEIYCTSGSRLVRETIKCLVCVGVFSRLSNKNCLKSSSLQHISEVHSLKQLKTLFNSDGEIMPVT